MSVPDKIKVELVEATHENTICTYFVDKKVLFTLEYMPPAKEKPASNK